MQQFLELLDCEETFDIKKIRLFVFFLSEAEHVVGAKHGDEALLWISLVSKRRFTIPMEDTSSQCTMPSSLLCTLV